MVCKSTRKPTLVDPLQQVGEGRRITSCPTDGLNCLAGSTKEVAKAVTHTTDNIRAHWRSQDRDTNLRMKLGTSSALAIESCLTKSTASSLHRPPVSIPTTTNLRVKTWQSVMSTASHQNKEGLAPRPRCVCRRWQPRKYASKRTRAPAWRHTRANTLSIGVACFFTRPLSVPVAAAGVEGTVAHFTCRFCDKQRQLPSFQEQRNNCCGIVHSLVVEAWARAAPALQPECERRCARFATARLDSRELFRKKVSEMEEAQCCHPCVRLVHCWCSWVRPSLALGVLVFRFWGLGLQVFGVWLGQTWSWPNLDLAKLGLALPSRNLPTWTPPEPLVVQSSGCDQTNSHVQVPPLHARTTMSATPGVRWWIISKASGP